MDNINNPKLSIVIPTRNRQEYCIKALKHIDGLKLNDTEIIIQDNSSNDRLKQLILDSKLNNIKYYYNPNIVSFVDNFSDAISRCKGKYICMIGDDDSILPNIINVVEYASNNNIDAVIPPLQVYHWPSDVPLKKEWRNGFLATLPYRTNNYKKINVEDSLKRLIKNHFQDYQNLSVPRIYHGLVKRECIEKIKDTCGVYFGGLTPDMFMSVALCFTVRNVVSYSKPFTISGICPKSGSSDSATGKHTGELKDAPHFRGHDEYNWISYIPYIYTVETIWAETGIQALRLMSKENYESLFNIKDFISYLSCRYPQFSSRLYSFGNKYDLTQLEISNYQKSQKRKHYLNRLTSLIVRVLTLNIAQKYYNVDSIDKACKILCNKYKIN